MIGHLVSFPAEMARIELCPVCNRPCEDGFLLEPETDEEWDVLDRRLGSQAAGECRVDVHEERSRSVAGGRWHLCVSCAAEVHGTFEGYPLKLVDGRGNLMHLE